MTLRELVGYALLFVLLLSLGWQWLRWRRAVRLDRIKRWGTPRPPSHIRRRGRL